MNVPPPDLEALAAEALARCDALAAASEEPGRLTRTFLRPSMRAAVDLVASWMGEAGMTTRVDAAGNVIGHRPGSDGEASPVLLIGSHLDTVPDAGRFDGALGVLLGIAAVRAAGRLPFAVEVVGFSEEEGVRYRTPYLGSLAMAGRFDPALLDLEDADGIPMAAAFRSFGLDPARVAEAAAPPGRILAYVEAHIEQGPALEAWGLPVGVVTAIAGQSRLWVSFEGRAGHAGTEPMELRRDALPAAASLVLEAERLARSVEGLRATVGTIAAHPGAVNVVPGSASMTLDVRHASDSTREKAVADLLAFARSTAEGRGLTFRVDQSRHQAAVPADPDLTARLAWAVREAGVEARALVSGAGHDGAVMASVAPTAMLFLRSPGGISHHPAESVIGGDVTVALDVLTRFLTALEFGDGPFRNDP